MSAAPRRASSRAWARCRFPCLPRARCSSLRPRCLGWRRGRCPTCRSWRRCLADSFRPRQYLGRRARPGFLRRLGSRFRHQGCCRPAFHRRRDLPGCPRHLGCRSQGCRLGWRVARVVGSGAGSRMGARGPGEGRRCRVSRIVSGMR